MAFQQIVSFMDESGLLQLAFDSKTQKTQMGPAQKERNKQERTIEAIKLRMEHIRFLQDAEKRYNERLENLGKPEDFPVDSRRKENSRKRLQKRLALCLENRKHVETKVKNYQRMLENQGSQTAKAQVPEEKQREQQGGRRRTLMVRRTKNLDTLKQMELRLRLDDTLLIVMRRALWELRSSFSNTLKAASDGRKPSISISNLNRRLERSIGARTTLKTIMSRYLANRLEAYRRDPRLSGLLSQVGSLNLNEEKMKEEIIRLVDSNTYTIVEAATGSGKSTQIPRIILNNAIENQLGGFCKVICVQPRRIAASSVARRVASERDEPLGMSVGYHVRLDGIHPKRTGSITYCTTGILLELLRHVPGYLDSVSHIVLDEVHERDIGLDLLMLMLKVSIDERQAAGAHVPKVVVTSATVDVDLFASYFQNRLPDGTFSPAPHVSVPGRTFHVTKHSLDALIPDLPRVFTLQQRRILFRAPPTQMYVKEQLGSGVGDTLGIQWADTGESTVYDPKLHGMPVGLLCAAILYVLKTTTEGAILVFLPGLRDIFDVEMELENLGPSFGFNFSDSLGPKIFKLHSNLPEGHDEPFNRGEPGCRRIFLATNIAETSITITDVRFVIDTGKVRQSIYYPDTRASELGYSWISKSSATQRAGRAGRVRDGEYFALFTDKTYESFRLTQKPEMALEDLQELCLRVKNTSPAGRIDGFLRQAIEAPEEERVRLAIQGLQHTGALDEHEELTTLGHYLTRLPVHPTLGRLVILGIVFRCLDPLLITAALGNDLNIFRTLEDADAIALKSEIRKDYAGLSSSDQLTAIRIISVIRDVYYRDGPDAGRACADSHFVHFSRFRTALESARVIVRALTRMNLIPPQVPKPGGNCQFGGHDLNVNSGRLPLIKALLLHANTLNLAVPVIDTKKPEEIQETQRVPSVQKSLYRTDTMRVAGISMRSMNASRPPKGLIMYDSKNPTPTGKFDLHNTTSITPLTACLFGGPLQMHDNTLVVDSWLKLQVDVDSDRGQAYATKLLFELRKALDRVSLVYLPICL